MKKDCPYLKANAHDGAWEMVCLINGKDCSTNWEKYKKCNVYKHKGGKTNGN